MFNVSVTGQTLSFRLQHLIAEIALAAIGAFCAGKLERDA